MDQENRKDRQPVAVDFFYQSTYPDEPFRQIEYEILYIEKGSGLFYTGNSVLEVHSGDFVFIGSFEEHYFKPDAVCSTFYCYRILFDVSALGSETDPCRNFFEKIKLCRFLRMPDEIARRFVSLSGMRKDLDEKDLIMRSILLDILSYAIETDQYERFSKLSGLEKRSISAIDNALLYIRENYSENYFVLSTSYFVLFLYLCSLKFEIAII